MIIIDEINPACGPSRPWADLLHISSDLAFVTFGQQGQFLQRADVQSTITCQGSRGQPFHHSIQQGFGFVDVRWLICRVLCKLDAAQSQGLVCVAGHHA